MTTFTAIRETLNFGQNSLEFSRGLRGLSKGIRRSSRTLRTACLSPQKNFEQCVRLFQIASCCGQAPIASPVQDQTCKKATGCPSIFPQDCMKVSCSLKVLNSLH